MSNHVGYISNPGVIAAGLLDEKPIRLPYGRQVALDPEVVAEAEGRGRIEFKIRTIKRSRETSAAYQRSAWSKLIIAAATASNRR